MGSHTNRACVLPSSHRGNRSTALALCPLGPRQDTEGGDVICEDCNSFFSGVGDHLISQRVVGSEWRKEEDWSAEWIGRVVVVGETGTKLNLSPHS